MFVNVTMINITGQNQTNGSIYGNETLYNQTNNQSSDGNGTSGSDNNGTLSNLYSNLLEAEISDINS